MERTINGRSISEIRSLLKEPLPDSALKYSDELNITYVKCEEVRKRMDIIFGLNYTEDYDIRTEVLPDENGEMAPFIQVKCTIQLLDDTGNLVRSCARWSGDRITKLSNNRVGYIANLGNDIDGACSDAFKRCCREIGITSEKVGKGNRIGNQVTARVQQPVQKESSGVITVTYASDFKKKGSSGGYSAEVMADGVKMELLIWKSASEPYSAKYGSEWFKAGFSGKKEKLYAKRGSYQGMPQLTFERFA